MANFILTLQRTELVGFRWVVGDMMTSAFALIVEARNSQCTP